ncbi:hypothetical protein AVEN_274731-1 [Araneus ventricosus]|uniref:Uncharacterized protein n=1 Tax=Araneus ventricosus TaxID=182803 RepID=A0A4Y2NYX9_ARAVE|nr:hypothetical protein AVEN_274731-1 [Araneus ventricosus]
MYVVSLSHNKMTRMPPEPARLSSNFRATPAGGHLAPTDLTCTRPAINWDSITYNGYSVNPALSVNDVYRPVAIISRIYGAQWSGDSICASH